MPEPYVYRGSTYRDTVALQAWHERAAPEEVLEPDLPIVDPHHHLWENPVRGRYLVHDLVADLEQGGHNIVQTVFAECESMYRAAGPEPMRPLGEIEFVRGAAAMSASGRYGPTRIAAGMIGFAELTLRDQIAEVLEAEVAAGGGILRGLRYSTPWDEHREEVGRYVSRYTPPGLLRDATFRQGVARLAEFGLSFDAWVYHPQLPDVVELARAFPEIVIVLDHVGGPLGVGPYAGRRDEVFHAWRAGIRDVAACPNVRVKLGGLGMLHPGFDFQLHEQPPSSATLATAWRPYLETCIEAFGPDRGMFESNFPVDKQSCGYRALWNAFKRITAGASGDEKAALFAGTARETYRLA
jgi:L-fuconolactonase